MIRIGRVLFRDEVAIPSRGIQRGIVTRRSQGDEPAQHEATLDDATGIVTIRSLLNGGTVLVPLGNVVYLEVMDPAGSDRFTFVQPIADAPAPPPAVVDAPTVKPASRAGKIVVGVGDE